MLEPVRHVGALARWAVRRNRDENADREALAAHAWSESAAEVDLPAGLRVRWLGTAGYALSYADHDILIDPYVTRLPLHRLATPHATPPDQALVDRYLPRADAVLMGHTHFDHALDAPAVVRRHQCPVYGSQSVATLLGLYEYQSHATVVEPYEVYEIGPFEVTFVPSVHSKLALGMWVPNSGPITCDSLDRLSPRAFNCDQVWGIHINVAGVSFYHQGSADLIDEAVRHRGVDYFLCGIAGRQFSPRYVERVLRRLEPRVVVPNHYDNFFKPLTGPMGFTVDVGVARFTEEVAAVSRDFEIRALGPNQTIEMT
ncbi:MAG: MBL fold metallo-hydrolase [Acidimicrobiales bacterium]